MIDKCMFYHGYKQLPTSTLKVQIIDSIIWRNYNYNNGKISVIDILFEMQKKLTRTVTDQRTLIFIVLQLMFFSYLFNFFLFHYIFQIRNSSKTRIINVGGYFVQ